MTLNFDLNRNELESQFESPAFLEDSGLSTDELWERILEIEKKYSSRAIAKAKTFELIANHARIAPDKSDIFQDKILHGGLMLLQRERWQNEIIEKHLKKEFEEKERATEIYSTYMAMSDFSHTSPNSRLMLDIGLIGLLRRVENAEVKPGLTDKQKEFYLSCKIVLNAIMTVAKRLAELIKPYNEKNAEALLNIASKAPADSYEAMQLLILYYFMHEYVLGTRVRTLGRLDVLLNPFFKRDIESGKYTEAEICEMLKYFLYKFWSAKVPYDLPFCLGGIDSDGREVTNEASYLIVKTYNSLNIYSPKIHIRVSDKTPKEFVKLVLSCIRGGNSSFVFTNDKIAIESLMRVGIEERDAMNYVPIGCYEPAVWGVEIGCTGNGYINLAKAVELVLCNGKDFKTGDDCGVKTPLPESFEDFLAAVKEQIAYLSNRSMSYVTQIERHYGEISPDPILSSQYDMSIERGVDVYEGGAKYNNSSLYMVGIATLVDSLCAIQKLVFEDKLYTLAELSEILKSNWKKDEKARRLALSLKEKYGNGNEMADGLTKDLTDFCASLVTGRPNGRGGVFKAAICSIDFCYKCGSNTMATPDGRMAGEPISKNLSPTIGMDRSGVTALINSVTNIDLTAYPTGSVLDIMFHPSAVSGDDGLNAFFGILMTYMKKGGFAMHGNVFDSSTLKAAQKNPEKYRNLQVRVCGWNAYFVNLSKIEQDSFIKQAESCG